MLGDVVVERRAVDELERDHQQPIFFDALEKLAQVLAVELAQDLHLAAEAPEDLPIAVQPRMDRLERDDLVIVVDVEIARAVDMATGAAADRFQDLVALRDHPARFEGAVAGSNRRRFAHGAPPSPTQTDKIFGL